MEEKGYRLPRHGDNVEELLKKMENLKQDFVLLKGCGDRWKYDSEGVIIGKECFFDFTYDELAEPVMAGKVVFLMWEDRVDEFPSTLCTCSYMDFGVSGVVVKHDGLEKRRVLLLTRGENGEIVVSADEEMGGVMQENDPIFTQWRQEYPNAGDEPLSILEIEELCNF